MAQSTNETPMMRQYREIRAELPENTLLLFRLGDFYELFEDDAVKGSRALGITLTKRHEMPMAGIPFHAADAYIGKLLDQGIKVGIVDQIETPRPGKLVKRALTRILSPGTLLEDTRLEPRNHHFLAAVHFQDSVWTAAWLELSTGEFNITATKTPGDLASLLASLQVREVILPEEFTLPSELFAVLPAHKRSSADPETFDLHNGYRETCRCLKVLNLDGFGISESHPALGAAGAVLQYTIGMLCGIPENLSNIHLHLPEEGLRIDPATQRNLEIFRSAQGSRQGSLIHAIDHTVTPSGSRLLESWLCSPSLDLTTIHTRQQIVGSFLALPADTDHLRKSLTEIRDLHRILSRLQNKIRNPRELGGIRQTLSALPLIRQALSSFEDSAIQNLADQILLFPDLCDALASALSDSLPADFREGGVIRDGWNPELDHLRNLSRQSKSWISEFEAEERERTGIRNLKIKYNGAFGYFIEVTKSNLQQVPPDYLRRQTLTNAERYTTPELKHREKEILEAEETANQLEESLFEQLVTLVLAQTAPLLSTALALAQLDCLSGWSILAREWNYCRPEVDQSRTLDITDGRHPVIEQILRQQPGGLAGNDTFVPNDCALDASARQIALLTGPNMAGKSTYIRQVALIALLAQIGCWVPARTCRIGLADRIFSRVGASDELARGNSTFMVEMNETANILHHATSRSLIVLDEIGRGTSTYDGLSIAWAVMEHLHGTEEEGPRTLFATHYHELTQLAGSLPRLFNLNVVVKEWNEEIIFLRKVAPGAADRSYGIQVARLAGLPRSVIHRAQVILSSLENEGGSPISSSLDFPPQPPAPKGKSVTTKEPDGQLKFSL
ncbi:MAG: DNA mismatch repair protein MutS [Puniceicoccaceae bacterium]